MSWKDKTVERWHKANPELVSKYKKKYAATHPRTKEQRQHSWAYWYSRNREKYLAAKRDRKKRDRARYNELESRRRAKKKGASIEDCAKKFEALKLERFCRWCCARLSNAVKRRQVDHIIPLSRGGLHIPDNLCACCISCNSSKGNKLVHEWLPFQTFEATS